MSQLTAVLALSRLFDQLFPMPVYIHTSWCGGSFKLTVTLPQAAELLGLVSGIDPDALVAELASGTSFIAGDGTVFSATARHDCSTDHGPGQPGPIETGCES